MTVSNSVHVIIAGNLASETIINLNGGVLVDQLGGNLAYTCAAYHLWCTGDGLISRVDEDYPQEYIEKFLPLGSDISGIHRTPQKLDLRAFYSIINEEKIDSQDPVHFFSKLKMPLPKSLLGYSGLPYPEIDSRNKSSPLTFRPEDVPDSYLDASFAYLGDLDYLSLNFLPPHLRNRSVRHILLKPSRGTLNPSFWYEFPTLVRGSTVVICTQKSILNLFLGRTDNLWDIAQTIASCGVDHVIITCGAQGQLLYNRVQKKRWQIPAYPVSVVDPIHASDAFAGGFLAGYRLHYDALMATIYGNVSASLKIQGSGPFYPLGALPDLVQSRLDLVRAKVIEC